MDYTIREGTKGIIFDLDGTLADTMPSHLKAWQLACQDFGFEMSADYLRERTGRPAWEISRDIVKEYKLEKIVDPGKLFERKIERYKSFKSGITAIEPVAEIVKRYHKNLKMAIGTGAFREAAFNTLSIIGMQKYFDIVITADDVTNHKPDPETFLKCAEQMKLKPSEIEVFEDGDLGILAAQRAGMHPIDVRPWTESW